MPVQTESQKALSRFRSVENPERALIDPGKVEGAARVDQVSEPAPLAAVLGWVGERVSVEAAVAATAPVASEFGHAALVLAAQPSLQQVPGPAGLRVVASSRHH